MRRVQISIYANQELESRVWPISHFESSFQIDKFRSIRSTVCECVIWTWIRHMSTRFAACESKDVCAGLVSGQGMGSTPPNRWNAHPRKCMSFILNRSSTHIAKVYMYRLKSNKSTPLARRILIRTPSKRWCGVLLECHFQNSVAWRIIARGIASPEHGRRWDPHEKCLTHSNNGIVFLQLRIRIYIYIQILLYIL